MNMGNIVRKDKFENSFDNLDKYLSNFSHRDSFVMESTGFYVYCLSQFETNSEIN